MSKSRSKKKIILSFSLIILFLTFGTVVFLNRNNIFNGKLLASVSCPSGYELNQGKTKCIKCPSGTKYSSTGYCYKAATAKDTYVCNTIGTVSGSKCKYAPNYCPNGRRAWNGKCTLSVSSPEHCAGIGTYAPGPAQCRNVKPTYCSENKTNPDSDGYCYIKATPSKSYSCSSGGSYKGYVAGLGSNLCLYNPTTTNPTSSGGGSGSGSGSTTPKKYKVTYCSDSSCSTKKTVTATAGQKFNVLAYNTFIKTGYTNTKWKESNGTSWTIANTNNKNYIWDRTSNVTLYATWEANTYTIIFKKRVTDATGTMENQTMTYGTEKALSKNNFKYKGYKMVWNTAADGSGTTFTDGQKVKNLSNKKGAKIYLYAQWSPITYTISFNSNGGTGSMSNMAKTFNVVKQAPECTFVKDGYFFNGWNLKENGSCKMYQEGDNIGNLTTVQGSTHYLYAQWVDENTAVNPIDGRYIVSKLNDTPKVLRKIRWFKEARMYDKSNEIGENTRLKTGNKINASDNEYVISVVSDTNQDGKLSVADVVKTYSLYKNNTTTKDEIFYAADINSDNSINQDDVTLMYQTFKGDDK